MRPALAAAAALLFALLVGAAAENRGSRDAGWTAFKGVASVLTSPRCLNCHVPGESPLQGDQGVPHALNVRRAADGRGTPAVRCTNCHQAANSEARHSPPGAPDWRLPPPSMRMAWQGLTTEEVCRSLTDPARNGGRTLAQLEEHVASDAIVSWGWNPGPGRKPPPLSHAEFVQRFGEWKDAGAPCGPSRSQDEH